MKSNEQNLARIKDAVCRVYQINAKEFDGPRRFKDFVNARFHYWNILSVDMGLSQSRIARIHNTDRGTISNALHRIKNDFPPESKLFRSRDAIIKQNLKIKDFKTIYDYEMDERTVQ